MDIAALFAQLASSSDIVYRISPSLRILRVNEAWDAFASANDGEDVPERWSRGASIDEVIPVELRPFYLAAYARVTETQVPWFHD